MMIRFLTKKRRQCILKKKSLKVDSINIFGENVIEYIMVQK